MSLAPGARLGPYEIVSLVGAGGMGEIYKAKDTRLDRTVAVKVLTSRLANDPHFRERFNREARTISQLDHPHICTLYDVGVHDGAAYLVMQYLDGETLADRLHRGPLPPDVALKCAIEILDALAAAHRFGVTHRDLKPANIMLTRSGAKLLDFGIAKLRASDGVAGTSGSITVAEPAPLTTAGTIVGTLHYMSPEQLQGHEGDARSDIFAIGAVLYETLTGKKAFDGPSQASVIAAILERELPASNGHVLAPPALDRLVRKCLAKDPDERWQTAKDLGDELRWVLQSAPSAIVPASGVEHGVSTPALAGGRIARRRRFIFRITIGISLSALITTGLLLRVGFKGADTSNRRTGDQAASIAKEPVTSPVLSKEVRTNLDSAQVLFIQKNYEAARGKAEQVLVVDPVNAQARELLAKLDAQIAQRTGGRESPEAVRELQKLYQREVVSRCRVLVPGRYPFGSGNDMALADFGDVFGYGGLFDMFFTDNIANLVDRSQRPWTWRPQAMTPPAGMLTKFERAERIREMFFSARSKTPKLGFIVRLSNLDPSASRFYVNIDGQTSAVTPGSETRTHMVWPGANTRSFAVALFEDRTTAPEQVAAFQGPWALFRLIDAGRTPPVGAQPGAVLDSMLRFQTALHRAQVVIEAEKTTGNPFASREWRQFDCEP